jgi:predicted  nucleic acid-binding Zn-ribbon protein
MIKILVAILLLMPLSAFAQRQKRDPLSDLEVDKLRDAAQTPDVRLKLYLEFARTRLDHLQQAKADTKATDRDQQMQDALQDFIDIYDELNDNVDTFADRDDDLRKALKPVIEADTEFGSKLRAFKASLTSSREEFGKYDYLVGTALQAVDDAAKDHRSLLAEQEEKFKNKKEKPHKERNSGG